MIHLLGAGRQAADVRPLSLWDCDRWQTPFANSSGMFPSKLGEDFFAGKNLVITGGGSGIGKAAAEAFTHHYRTD